MPTPGAHRDRDADEQRRDELERELLQHDLGRPRLLGEPEQPERHLADHPAENAELEPLHDARFIGRGFHGSLVCDKLEKTYEELVAKGVEFITPPTKAPWGSFAVFKDIDGNRFVMSAA